eukprot:COSAG06_NODE_495_length_15047_cov_11.349478_12_plen_161_part_00
MHYVVRKGTSQKILWMVRIGTHNYYLQRFKTELTTHHHQTQTTTHHQTQTTTHQTTTHHQTQAMVQRPQNLHRFPCLTNHQELSNLRSYGNQKSINILLVYYRDCHHTSRRRLHYHRNSIQNNVHTRHATNCHIHHQKHFLHLEELSLGCSTFHSPPLIF